VEHVFNKVFTFSNVDSIHASVEKAMALLQMEIAKANQEKAYLQFEQSLLKAGKEVSDALAQYNNETTKIAVREKQVDALKKAANYSDELLTYGLANYLEVLTSKNDALNAQLSLIDNKFQQYKAVIQLYKALGGGWQ